YENSNERKLISYIKSSIKALKGLAYDNRVTVQLNNQTITTYPFLIFISNSNEMGYNVSLTPNASLIDGLLDVLIVSKMNKLKSLVFGLLILFKRHHLMKEAQSYQTKHIKIQQSQTSGYESQIDGEFFHIERNEITVSLLEKSLNVIA
ncbi:MAG: diacylglycerol kinase family lipid kinase, partial [Gelidibacter sp.]|nr:diacylglycerol kinase family lipid kinase [Gelidibacter sp.]